MSTDIALLLRAVAIGGCAAAALLVGGVGATYLLRAVHLRAQRDPAVRAPARGAVRAAVGEMWSVLRLLVLRFLRIDARRLRSAANARGATPVVLVHGFSADGTSMWPLARALARAGHPVHTPHLGRMGRALSAYVLRLERVVDDVLAPLPGDAQIDLVAHSLGGVMVRGLLQKRPDIRARVRRVVTVASPHRGTLVAMGIPLPEARDVRVGAPFLDTLTPLEQLIAAEQVLTFSSAHDAIVYPASTCAVPGATHHAFEGVGHAQLLFDTRVQSSWSAKRSPRSDHVAVRGRRICYLHANTPKTLRLAPSPPPAAAVPPAGDLSARQLHFVCGKGGTGKSVVACALARELVQRGGRVLLVQVNAKDSHARMLGIPSIGDDVHEALPGLFVVNTTPAASLKEYALMTLRFETVYRAVFENRVTRAFLRFMPALSELTMLGKITYHAGELRPGFPDGAAGVDARRFTHIVVDCPATGHGLKFLDTARVIAGALKRGPLADKTREMAALLADPTRSALHTVTLPDELPVNEATELVARARATGVVPLGLVVVNQMSTCLFTPALRESLQRALSNADNAAADGPALRALAVGAFRAQRETKEAHEQKRVHALGLPVVELPRLPAADLGRPELERLARKFDVVLGHVGRSSA